MSLIINCDRNFSWRIAFTRLIDLMCSKRESQCAYCCAHRWSNEVECRWWYGNTFGRRKLRKKTSKETYHFERSRESAQEFLIRDNGQSEPKRFRHSRVKFLTFFALVSSGFLITMVKKSLVVVGTRTRNKLSVAGFLRNAGENLVKTLSGVREGGKD